MSGSQHPKSSQHPQHPSDQANVPQAGSSNMNNINAHSHELQARLAYAELISPPQSTRGYNSEAYFPQQSPPLPVDHRQAHFHSPQAVSRAGPSWTGVAAERTQYQVFGGTSRHGNGPQTAESLSTMYPASPTSTHSSPQSPTSPFDPTIEEDKRRRNTEASARFRMKKKERMQNMEQTMSDLQRKAEDLEKEAGDLRRENSWLKEMVIMKGKRRGTLGQDRSEQGTARRGDVAGDDEDSDGLEE